MKREVSQGNAIVTVWKPTYIRKLYGQLFLKVLIAPPPRLQLSNCHPCFISSPLLTNYFSEIVHFDCNGPIFFRNTVSVRWRDKCNFVFFFFKDQFISHQVCTENCMEPSLGLINVLIKIKVVRIITTKFTEYFTYANH